MSLRWLKNEYLQAALVLSAACLAFLSAPILHFRDHLFSPAGLLQNNTLTRVVESPAWVNPYLGDVVYVIQPWLLYNRDRLRAGHLPLWNPYNGSGMPHLANYQSATFSLFTLPFYVLDFKAAVLLSSYLALFAHGFFTFAFLKQVRLHQAAALLGAVTHMFGGYHILWLGWLPLVGSGVTLPAALFFAEATFNHLQSGKVASPRALTALMVGFALSILVGLLAGHPETFYAALVLTAVYVSFRLLRWLKHLGWSKRSVLRVLGLGSGFVVAALIALMIAGVQWVPFLEYLNQAGLRGANQKSSVRLPLDIAPLLVFPRLLGDPSAAYHPTLKIHDELWNFPESVSLYVGGITLLLAALSILFVRRDWHVRFFGLAAIIWLVYVFDLFSTRAIFKLLPGASIVLPIRTYDIWLFSVSCSAALFAHHAIQLERASLRRAAVSLLAGIALLLAGWWGALTLVRRFAAALFEDALGFVNNSLVHVAGMSLLLFIGAALAASLFLVTRRWQRLAAVVALALAIFYQEAYAFRAYNPTLPDPLFYPTPTILQRLRQSVGDATLVILGYDTIPPNVNMQYRLRMLPGYDGFWSRPQRRLYRAFFDAPPSALIPSMKAEPRALQIFGVEYVATVGQEALLSEEEGFKLLWRDGPVHLYRYEQSLTRYFAVDAAQFVQSREDAWSALHAPDFDPSRAVLIVGEPAGSVGQAASRAQPAQVLSDAGDRVTLKVKREQPGYLVAALAHDPGWKATVNGQPQPVLLANYALSALAIPSGESIVELRYDPDSFKMGVALTIVGLALAAALVAAGLTCRRRARSA